MGGSVGGIYDTDKELACCLDLCLLLPNVTTAYTVASAGTLNTVVQGLDGLLVGAVLPLTAELVYPTTKGTLTLQPDGHFVYVHAGIMSGIDSFTYKVTDGTSYSSEAAVNITIT